MTFDSLWPLVLLAIVPFVWWARRRTLTNFTDGQLALQAATRATVVTALALALMQPVAEWPSRAVSVVSLLDLSDSVSPAGRAAAAQWVDEASRRGRPAHARTLAFGAQAVAVRGGADLETVALDRRATNLEVALDEARRSFAPHHLKRLVLATDGHATAGDLRAAVARLRRDGVRVYTLAVPGRAIGDAWVETVAAPDVVLADEPFAAEVTVFSQREAAGTLELRRGRDVLVARPVRLSEGPNRLVLEARVKTPGSGAIAAALGLEGDPVPENNRDTRPLVVLERPRVLYVEGRAASARYLRDALGAGGFVVDVRSPAALLAAPAALHGYAAVVLSDVPAEALSAPQMEAIAAYVADLGGGVVLAGGDAVYGEKGYKDTPLERVLPVAFTVEEKPEDVALVIVLDKSWSMAGAKIELTKEAAKAAVDVLEDRYHFGVVAFNHTFDWPVPIQRVADREAIKERISTIVPSSHTNIFPALEEAHVQISKMPARIRHVILLSDGRTYPDAFETLVKRMVASRITVSSVAVGEEADRELLQNIATWGQGRSYDIRDVNEVPQIFAKETERALKPTLVEEAIRVSVAKRVEMLTGIDFASAPPLLGYTSMEAKDTAETLLVTNKEDPLLVRWQYGLGRTTAFASDVKNRWAVNWLGWRNYGKFWTQVVRETMRRPEEDATRAFRVARDGDRVRVAIEIREANAAAPMGARPQVEVLGPNRTRAVVDAAPAGRGVYEATVPLAERGPYVFRLPAADGVSGRELARAVDYVFPDEYRFGPPDVELLRAISADTGGAFQPRVEDVFADHGEVVPRPVEFWPYLAALALALYLLDLLLRRVRLFEPDV